MQGVQNNSFYFRVAKGWNELDQNIVESEKISIFKARIDATWMGKTNKFAIEQLIEINDEERFGETF